MADLNRQDREARERMAAAERQSERQFSADPARPRRYKLYDKIKDHVSLRTIDIVIAVTALLIVVFLVYGIITANPTQ